MNQICRLLFLAVFGALCASAVGAENIVAARYAMPVERYGHFALGRPHEYAQLIAVTDSGRSIVLALPADAVFEDRAPRLVRLTAEGPQQILAIVSQRDSGSRLALVRLHDGALEIGARSAAIGTPMRWMNPVGVADLDGDGRAEVAAVTTPHIGGTLRIYRQQERALVEVAALAGFSNHVYGSTELGMSALMPVGGRMQLLVPDVARLHLRLIALEGGRLVETGKCVLPAPLVGAIKVVSPSAVSLELSSGRQVVALPDCYR